MRSFFDLGGTAEALIKEICQERCTIANVDDLWSEYCAQTLDEGAKREKPKFNPKGGRKAPAKKPMPPVPETKAAPPIPPKKPQLTVRVVAVAYTHLTLPTKRIG